MDGPAGGGGGKGTGRQGPTARRAYASAKAQALIFREFFDSITAANHSALQHAAEHPSAPPELSAEPWPDSFHLIARSADRADFQSGLADPEQLANAQTVHVHAVRLNILHAGARRHVYTRPALP